MIPSSSIVRIAPILALLGCGTDKPDDSSETDSSVDETDSPVDTSSDEPLPAAWGDLTTANSIGRTGAWYLPTGYNLGPIPLLVAFHGTGGQGLDMVTAFTQEAETWRFGIVAPSSRQAPTGEYTWEVGTKPGEVTEDLTHAQNCLAEVLAMGDVATDPGHLMATGFSGGGSSAPYLATNDDRFTHCSVLHGGVFPSGLGSNIIPCWFSTGDVDTTRSPEEVEGQATSMGWAGFPDVVFEVFPGGHELIPEELDALMTWWLDSEG